MPNNVEPELKDDGIGDVYGIVIGLTSDGFSYAQVKEYADNIKDSLIALDEAAKVSLGGLQEERVFVEFDNTKLKEYNLSANKLQNIISSTNILSTGGQVNVGDERIILEPTGNFNSINDIKDMLIPVGSANTQLVKLGDITQISKGYIDPPKQIVRINGYDAVTIHINLKKNANVIELGEKVNKIVKQWQQQLPIGLELTRVSSLDNYIEDKINDFVINLIQSISIVLLVMLVFLGFRTGFIIASLIPIVIIMTLMIMGLLDIGLNQVTLAALIMALLISTLTTSAAFLAFYLSPNQMGDIVGSIFVVITIALLSSWVIALTVITLFCGNYSAN